MGSGSPAFCLESDPHFFLTRCDGLRKSALSLFGDGTLLVHASEFHGISRRLCVHGVSLGRLDSLSKAQAIDPIGSAALAFGSLVWLLDCVCLEG